MATFEIEQAIAEMRALYGAEAFSAAATRAATAHLQQDMEAFEFWREVAMQLRTEGIGH